MPTTIWIDRATHARLSELKTRLHKPSLASVIQSLLDAPQESAQTLYARRKAGVDAACQSHGVRRLVAFGSRVRGDAVPGSDLDLAVVMPPRASVLDFIAAQRDIARAFACPVDIVPYPRDNPGLRRNIDGQGVVLDAG